MPVDLVIKNTQRTLKIKGEKIGLRQKIKVLTDKSDMRVHYQSLRDAMVDAPTLEHLLQANPGATVIFPKSIVDAVGGSKSEVPLGDWIKFCKTAPLPPSIPLVELGTSEVIEEIEEEPAPTNTAPAAKPVEPAKPSGQQLAPAAAPTSK